MAGWMILRIIIGIMASLLFLQQAHASRDPGFALQCSADPDGSFRKIVRSNGRSGVGFAETEDHAFISDKTSRMRKN
jgi:hypothetical protein